MKSKQKIDLYFKMIKGIKYENEHGGAYAYVQFLAYTRELISLLKPIKKLERHIEAIEGINWLFNEYLTTNFTYRQKVIFENKLNDLEVIFETITNIIQEQKIQNCQSETYIAKAA